MPTITVGDTTLNFAPTGQGAGLTSIVHRSVALFVRQKSPAPFWSLTFRSPTAAIDRSIDPHRGKCANEPVVIGNPLGPASGEVVVTGADPGAAVTATADSISWRLPVAAAGTCDVTLSWVDVDDAIHLELRVVNNSTWTLSGVAYPLLTLRPTPMDADEITLIFSRSFGRSWRNPFLAKERGFFHGANYGLEAPGPMQFGALIDDARRCLYIATYDGEARHKRFFYDSGASDPSDPRLEFRITHVPEGVGVAGNGYDAPYPVVLRTLEGDWWDVAQVYRAWALRQKWAARGPLRQRSDVPRWVKEAHAWARLETGNNTIGFEPMLTGLVDVAGTPPMGVQWYGWYHDGAMTRPDNWPPKLGAPELAAVGSAAGAHSAPYLNTLLWDTESPSYSPQVAAEAARNEDGAIMEYYDRDQGCVPVMCATSLRWKKQLFDTATKLMDDMAAKGCYLDQLGGQIDRPCYAATHGHPAGGGTYAGDHLRAFLELLRATLKQRDPDAIVAGEAFSEAMIDVSDVRLNHFDVWREQIPLWAAVYGDYCLSFGRVCEVDGPGTAADVSIGPNFAVRVATNLLRGSAIGRLRVDSRWFKPGIPNRAELVKEAVAARKMFADFLVYGHIQRQLDLEVMAPLVLVIDPKERKIQVPAAAGATWWDGETALLVLLVNITEDPVDCRFRVDLRTHEIPPASSYQVERVRVVRPIPPFSPPVTGPILTTLVRLRPREVAAWRLEI